MDLSTTYLGLKLAHPFIAGASLLAGQMDMARRLEDGGAAAIVMPALFEEQIALAESQRVHHMDPHDDDFAEALAVFPGSDQFALAPDAYLEQLRRLKSALAIPVIASMNGMTTEAWISFASRIEEAGADALEVNICQVAADADESSIEAEANVRNLVVELKRRLHIPIAVKVGPFFTMFGYFAHWLDRAGADGLVLFSRFYQPDIDLRLLTFVPRLELSTSAELRLRLHWLALLCGRLRCSLALTGGVATPLDGVKAILAGADAVQMVSAVLRHGPRCFSTMRDALARWIDVHEFRNVGDVRGRLSVAATAPDRMIERGSHVRIHETWPDSHPVTDPEGQPS